MIILKYLIPVIPDMMKAAMPITGGMIGPPLEAAASIPPACSGVYPVLFMAGIVKDPVILTLAAACPVIEPTRPLVTTRLPPPQS